MKWEMKNPRMTLKMMGLIPSFINEFSTKPAKEQINRAYSHGGGWDSFTGFTMLPNGDLSYPGDPPARLLAETQLRDETIRLYEHSWVAIIQKDGSFEVSRVD